MYAPSTASIRARMSRRSKPRRCSTSIRMSASTAGRACRPVRWRRSSPWMRPPRSGRTTSRPTRTTTRSSHANGAGRRGPASERVGVLAGAKPLELRMDSPYLDFDRPAWAALREATPLTLTETDLSELRGLNERVSLADVEEIYLPVSRLLNLHVAATQNLHKATDIFLGSAPAPTPYVIGVGGSVAVGKSTFARVLRALLARWPDHPRVDLVTTDGFLLSNRVLEERGLLARKGFPESYDVRSLVQFMADVKAAAGAVHAPVYSHQKYDIVPGEFQVVDRPDIVIV